MSPMTGTPPTPTLARVPIQVILPEDHSIADDKVLQAEIARTAGELLAELGLPGIVEVDIKPAPANSSAAASISFRVNDTTRAIPVGTTIAGAADLAAACERLLRSEPELLPNAPVAEYLSKSQIGRAHV